tara:strand:+ start:1761 stop:2801 length:1041 start_codon:yes stop_codon:yes gene_type:complete
MDFDLSDDQIALQDAARSLLDDRCDTGRVRAAMEDGGFDRDLWESMADQGWPGILVDSTVGGLGLGIVEAAVLLEQAGSHLAPVPFLQQLLATAALTGTPHLSPLVEGSHLGTAARRPVTRNGDGTVSGRPEPVLYGHIADVLVVPAADELVVVDLAGIDRRAEPAMDLTRRLAWIDLDHTPATTVGGPDEVARLLDLGALFHSAELLGGATAVLDMTVAYAQDREQFGRPIGSFQAVKHRCADMLVDVEGMRSAVYHAAWALGADDPDGPMAAATAKVWCSDAGLRVAESALQVHGGIGFTWEADVHLYLKRAQLDGTAFGNAGHHRSRLAAMARERLAAGEPLL